MRRCCILLLRSFACVLNVMGAYDFLCYCLSSAISSMQQRFCSFFVRLMFFLAYIFFSQYRQHTASSKNESTFFFLLSDGLLQYQQQPTIHISEEEVGGERVEIENTTELLFFRTLIFFRAVVDSSLLLCFDCTTHSPTHFD